MAAENKVYRLSTIGFENLKIKTENIPKPGNGQVLLKIHAVALNYRDSLIVKGKYPAKENLIPLADGAGEIVEVGEGVQNWKKGDRVTPNNVSEWYSGDIKDTVKSSLGALVDGLAAQYVIANAKSLVAIPDHLSYEEAATIPCAGITAWNALFEGPYPLVPGQTVLIEGTGGVSIFGLQFAVAAGARVIVTSSSNEKLKKAKELGATHTINYKENPEWEKEVLRLTNGQGVNHVIEIGGNNSALKALEASAIGGNIHVVGGVSGWDLGFPLINIIMKVINIRGVLIGSVDMFERMNAVISLKKIKPQVDKVFEFEQLAEAIKYLETGAHFGKVVVKV